MLSKKGSKPTLMTEDSRLTVSTRTQWAKYIPHALESAHVTAEMIALGAAEFLRYHGILTVEILVQDTNRTRMMVWRGSEEITIP